MDYDLKIAISLLKDVVEDSPCNLDHHGYCQEHNWFDNSECINSKIKKFLSKFKENNK